MNKLYNIKVNHKGLWLEYTHHYFIQSLEDYKDYLSLLNNRFTASKNEIKNNETFIGHGHSYLTGISGMFCGMINDKAERAPMLAHLTFLHGTVVSQQVKHLLQGDKLVINQNGGYFPIKPTQEYKCTIIANKQYTESDIKVSKWQHGSHYYAKIGKIDVIDKIGNTKWNTRQGAKQAAIQYLKKLQGEK